MNWVDTTKLIRTNARLVLEGRVLSIDPGSGVTSPTGWAYFENSQLLSSGIVVIPPHAPIDKRLFSLGRDVRENLPAHDILVIEHIRQNPHFRGAGVETLLKAVGAILASSDNQLTLSVSPSIWKKSVADEPLYRKTDENDAIWLGKFVLARALEESVKPPPRRKSPSTRKVNLRRKTL